jgi:hypothetical protein
MNQRLLVAGTTEPPEKKMRSSDLDGMCKAVLLSICMSSPFMIKFVYKEYWDVFSCRDRERIEARTRRNQTKHKDYS